LVVDPLSALQHRDCDADAEAAALDLIDRVKNTGITIVSTSLLGNVLPLNEQTPLNISTIADTWMHVSYVNQGGERNRALTIVKARGTGHSNQVRELILSDSGVTLSDVYAAGGEVLMGTLRWEKENEAKRARIAALSRSELLEQKASLALAETRAQLEVLTRAGAIQAAELEHLKAAAIADGALYASDAENLLSRRRADRRAETSPDAELEKPR
jgi:circadian clock protein KaiC